jgi:ribonuclease Z
MHALYFITVYKIYRSRDAAFQNMYRALGLRQMLTVDVEHRTRCFGVVIDHQDGWRIVSVVQH